MKGAALGLLTAGCVVQVSIERPPPPRSPTLLPTVPATARCEGGSLPVELTHWRSAVVDALAPRYPAAIVEAAELSCRSVVVSARPVIVGANTPSVVTLQETELELSVELRFRLTSSACVRQTFVGRSRWWVVPLEPSRPLAESVASDASRALLEAVELSSLSAEHPMPCPEL